jgi:peptidoglycan hydrolase CwlO-like protein
LETRLGERETQLAKLRDEHERLRVAQVEDRTQIMVLEGKRDELADALAATGASLSRAEAELLVLAAERDGQRERGDAFAARIAQAEAGLASADARAGAAAIEVQQLKRRHEEEAAAMQDKQREQDGRLETLRAELHMLEGALAQARADGSDARAELAALRRTATQGSDRSELRREIVRLADSLMETSPKREAAE